MAKFGVLFEVTQYVLVEVECKNQANAEALADQAIQDARPSTDGTLAYNSLPDLSKFDVVKQTISAVHSFPLKGNR